jgi:hypothetical protein
MVNAMRSPRVLHVHLRACEEEFFSPARPRTFDDPDVMLDDPAQVYRRATEEVTVLDSQGRASMTIVVPRAKEPIAAE